MNILLAGFIMVLVFAAPAQAIPVINCGTVVPEHDVGFLQNDLNCAGGTAVTLDPFATLEMNGHQISGAHTGVSCVHKRCDINGPGLITGSTLCAIQPLNNLRILVKVRGVDIDGNGCAIAGPLARVIKMRLDDMNVTNNGSGISGGRIKGTELFVTGHDTGGVDARRSVHLSLSTVQQNDGIGVIGRKRAILRDCSVVDNDLATGFDVGALRKPRLYNTTCGRSVMLTDPFTIPEAGAPSWGVCAGD